MVITGRRTDVTERFRRLAEEKLDKVAQLAPHAYRIDVEVSHERNPRQANHCERVEITVRDKGPVIRAEACTEDAMASFDLAFGKLLERLRRLGDRRKVHHGRHAPPSVRSGALLTDGRPGTRSENRSDDRLDSRADSDPSTEDDTVAHDAGRDGAGPDVTGTGTGTGEGDTGTGTGDLADSPVVIRTKDHVAAPMTIDQALYEMELVGHDFYLFVDAGCGKPSVVYRRRGWNYGVIHLEVASQPAEGSSDPIDRAGPTHPTHPTEEPAGELLAQGVARG